MATGSTTALERALALACHPDFAIRDSHARGRLGSFVDDEQRAQKVLCGALDARGRYACGEELCRALTWSGRRGDWRELAMSPGWVQHAGALPGGVWAPTKNLCWRLNHGYEPRWRKPQVL